MSSASVEGLQGFCRMRKLDLDDDNSQDAMDAAEMSVVYVTVSGGSFPVVSESLVVVPYTAWKLVMHACQVLGPGNVKQGFVGQSDFLFKVCWQGYASGALGIQVWRLVEGKWKKQFIPIVMLLAPQEDSRQYTIMYNIACMLLQRAILRLGWERPETLFAQIHSDFHASAAEAARNVLTGALLVNDLEHMFRNLKRHQTEDSRLRKVQVGQIQRYVGFSAFLPNLAIFSTFWKYKFQDLEKQGEGNWVKYFQQTYFKKQSGGIWNATWFCGCMSKARAGFAASQNLVESFNAQFRKVSGIENTYKCV